MNPTESVHLQIVSSKLRSRAGFGMVIVGFLQIDSFSVAPLIDGLIAASDCIFCG